MLVGPESLNYLECLSTNPCLCQTFDILELILWHGNVYCEENDLLFLAVG